MPLRQATLTLIITIMKALRFFFLSLLAAFSFAASAQTIEVYKDGRIIDSFSATQVDSVVYKQVAATPKYYYYVGTVKPTAENLATIGTELNGKPNWNSQLGCELSMSKKETYWVVVPEEWRKPIIMNVSTGKTMGLSDTDVNTEEDLGTINVGGVLYVVYQANLAATDYRMYLQ